MLTLEECERMRRAYYLHHKSIRQIAEEEGRSRETVSRVIAENSASSSQQRRNKLSPVFGPLDRKSVV